MKYELFGSLLAALILAGASCSASEAGSSLRGPGSGGGPGTGGGGSPGVGGTGGSGAIGGFGALGADDSGTSFDANADGACQAVSQEAKVETLPVDIVWAVDTSGSMLDEAAAVQDNVSAFSQQIVAANIDVHVVMLALKDPFLGVGVCVGPPLGTGNCTTPGGDSKPPTFFHHPSALVDSWNAALIFVSKFPDYQQFIRPSSLKYLVIVTDDNSSAFFPLPGTCGAYCDNPTAFINDYTALPMMRTASGARAWKISGVYAQTQCPNATRIGAFWKTVIDQTGGVHGDICACTNLTACTQTFKAVLDSLRDNIAKAAKPLDCEFTIPPPPPGQSFDQQKVNVELIDQTNGKTDIYHVDDASKCDPNLGGWYYDDNAAPTRVIACPQSCAQIKATMQGKINVLFGCATRPIPPPK